MAIVVAEALPVAQLLETVRAHAGAALQEAVVFDVYQGVGLEPGLKSVALGLTWQDPTDTLVDEQIDQWFGDIIEALSRTFDAKLRA
jgi:phenylalanyl-tRNA synthetase beta chain